MTDDSSDTGRRAFLAGLTAAGVGLAGCSSLSSRLDGGDGGSSATPTPTDTPTGTGTDTPTDTPEDGSGGNGGGEQPGDPGEYEPMEEAAATFEDISYWTAHAGVTLKSDNDTVYQGSQSARIEGRSGTIERAFPVPRDLSGKDLSLAMKIGGPLPTTLRVHLIDTGGNRTRLIQRYHTAQPSGWVRINPSINDVNADLSSIERIIITLDGGGEEKKYWVDDVRFHDKTTDRGQVMFTFDYITRSIYDIAYPMMKDRGIKGALAVPADNVGNADRLTWDEITELQDDGWEIASMSNDWEPLNGQSENVQRQRIERAINLITENGLDEPAALMYPKGFCDDTTIELAAENHDIAFTRYGDSEAGNSQSAIMGPQFVNRSRPNTPAAAVNQMDVVAQYNGLYTIAHNRIGPNAENSRAEFRQILNEAEKRQKQGRVKIVTPSDVVLQG